MVAGAILLAVVTVTVDEKMSDEWLGDGAWIYTGSAEGASTILGTIAGSMITVAGVVFSLTLVVLTLTSSQFGPRLLRNFMSDAVNQVVIGTFVSTFLYCLLVLRTIRHEGPSEFVPHLSVTVSVLLALASVGVLIFFIHHVAVSIQADEVVSRVSSELRSGINRLFPEEIGQEKRELPVTRCEPGLPENFDRDAASVTATRDGYLQLVDSETLMELAEENDVVLQLVFRPGHYVVDGSQLLRIWPADRATEKFAKEANSAFVLGNRRTPVQDIEFAVSQLVEVAVRALSPGINDPFTAISCVDRLSSALSRIAQREMPSSVRYDKNGIVRIVAPATSFAAITDAAFNQIRQNARTTASVTIRLLEAIADIAKVTTRDEDRNALRRHAEMIARGAREGLPEEADREVVEERLAAVMEALDS